MRVSIGLERVADDTLAFCGFGMLHCVPLVHRSKREGGHDADTNGSAHRTNQGADGGPRRGLAQDIASTPADHPSEDSAHHDASKTEPPSLSWGSGPHGQWCGQGFESWRGQFVAIGGFEFGTGLIAVRHDEIVPGACSRPRPGPCGRTAPWPNSSVVERLVVFPYAEAMSAPKDDQAAELRQWSVAGGVVVDAESRLLLVENKRRDDSIDWSTPGGVVDDGETFVEALTREVQEETGLVVAAWTGPLYRVEVTAPDAGFFLQVEAHRAADVSGEIVIDDPDGIVLSASYYTLEESKELLESAPIFVREPLLAHVVDGVDDGRTFAYTITGRGSDRRVRRT